MVSGGRGEDQSDQVDCEVALGIDRRGANDTAGLEVTETDAAHLQTSNDFTHLANGTDPGPMALYPAPARSCRWRQNRRC